MEWLKNKMQEIDLIDTKLIDLIKERFEIINKIGHYKKENNIPVMQNTRVEEIMRKCELMAKEKELAPELIKNIYKVIIDYACKLEQEMLPSCDDKVKEIIFCTLGPDGTCHSNAVKQFINFHSIKAAKIDYVDDFEDAVLKIKNNEVDYIVQNVAHPQIGLLNEKYRNEIYMNDSFQCPTISMGILRRKNGSGEKKIGIMPAAVNYIDPNEWDELIFETSNPKVNEALLNGKYNYGITFIHFASEYPHELELVSNFGGPVDTCWVVYGRNKRNIYGEVLGDKTIEY